MQFKYFEVNGVEHEADISSFGDIMTLVKALPENQGLIVTKNNELMATDIPE
ncbi:MAG: hypothetical protein HOG33_04510 [Candidatus Marinimicrobia bacterium]|jgi:hypothetical protein|nr:hypothetical protein [Candidatus Neomarinimicrobiota bacterium]